MKQIIPVIIANPLDTSIPNSNQGAKIVPHIVKEKNNELTKGEFVLTGSHFSAN